ncbi:MAG: IS110 family transposase, partial [Bacillota bacterium]
LISPHTKAIVACMRRLLHRIVRVMRNRRLYELRDLEDDPLDKHRARQMISQELQVSPEIRRRLTQRREAG